MKEKINVIAFDADDTIWINEPYFQDAELQFCELLKNYLPKEEIAKELFKTEMKNLHLYGYGIKGFILCMIETANTITKGNAPISITKKIINIGHSIIEKPVEVMDGVIETLDKLKDNYKLVIATKGDLLDQERKLKKSGLESYFHHIEIMSDKQSNDYRKLLNNLNCKSENFLMIGNSIKSDILPVLELGGNAAHIPFHVTWSHELHESKINDKKFIELKTINEIINYL